MFALTGWGLMVPPTRVLLGEGPSTYIDWNAPLLRWEMVYRSDSLASCKKNLDTVRYKFPTASSDRLVHPIYCAPCELKR